MHKEIELKLVTYKAAMSHFVAEVLPGLDIEHRHKTLLSNTYFDTAEGRLNAKRMALRVRNKEGIYIQTLKTKGESVAGLHQRNEWEWNIPMAKLDADLLAQTPWPDDISVSEVLPVFETNFQREAVVVLYAGARIELACDEGLIKAGDRSQSLCEIELELLEGGAESLFALAKWIATAIPVFPGNVSKAEQGYRLGPLPIPGFKPRCTMVSRLDALAEPLIDDAIANWQAGMEHFIFSNDLDAHFEAMQALIVLKAVVTHLVDNKLNDKDQLLEALQASLLILRAAGNRVAHQKLCGRDALLPILLEGNHAGISAIALGEWMYLRGRDQKC
ncbi:MAG: CYTH domain-containing protein [Hahellaceae bacterium]|nr:CYTH domain-containing protein [Hahellaceae bacterium]